MVDFRGRHFTDTVPDPLKPLRRFRAIRRASNWQDPDSGLWRPCAESVDAASGTPPGWAGNFDFSHVSLEGLLQCFAGHTTDPDNRAAWGFRRSDIRGVWCNFKAWNATAPTTQALPAQRAVRWVGLWTNTNLAVRFGADLVEKRLTLTAPGHPANFGFTILDAPGLTRELLPDGSMTWTDAQGVVRLRSKQPSGEDANGLEIRVSITNGPSRVVGGRTIDSIIITPNADDLAGATYPVMVDPTTEIQDDPNVEDNWLRSDQANANYGNTTADIMYAYADGSRKILIRIADESLIPAGTINSFVLSIMQSSTKTSDADAYKVSAANAGLVMGTANGAQQTGSSCWNYAQYNTVSWAGSAGCSTNGTDFDNSDPWAKPGADLWNGDVRREWTINTAWASSWRDSPSNNAGMIIIANGSSSYNFYDTNYATSTSRPIFKIDYTASGSSIAPHYLHLARMRA